MINSYCPCSLYHFDVKEIFVVENITLSPCFFAPNVLGTHEIGGNCFRLNDVRKTTFFMHGLSGFIIRYWFYLTAI